MSKRMKFHVAYWLAAAVGTALFGMANFAVGDAFPLSSLFLGWLVVSVALSALLDIAVWAEIER